jgi:WbqC-like protein family
MNDRKRVAVLQSNYLPWKGYFDIIHDVDLFIFYDDVQYTKNDWRNRNRIKTPAGPTWLTVPTGTDLHRLICEVRLPDPGWQLKHWKSLRQNYSRTPCFEKYEGFFARVYAEARWETLSELNQFLIKSISRDFLGIRTLFEDSRHFSLPEGRQDRLIDLLRQVGCTHYLSGPAGRSYLDGRLFDSAGIKLEYKDYGGYPEYEQKHPPFDHHVSVVDLLFNVGDTAPGFIWGLKDAMPNIQQT